MKTIEEPMKLNRKIVERIFKVNLKNRKFEIRKIVAQEEIGVCIFFFDKDNIFGYTESMGMKEFNKKLHHSKI